MKRLAAMALILTLALAAGCSKGKSESPPAVAQPPASSAESPPPAPAQTPQGPASGDVMPVAERSYSYYLNDGSQVHEYYVRDGHRLIGAYNGKTYVTWFVAPDGVWRQDPQGPGLLRYLPPVLQHGMAWKQTSGNEEVFFRLEQNGECPVGGERVCWELTVLNRKEVLLYRFVPGLGIAYAQSDNYKTPAESYVKEFISPVQAEIPPAAQMLRDGQPLPDGPRPAVTDVTPSMFADALKALRTKAGAILEVDLTGDGKPELIEGTVGQWHTAPLRLYDSEGRHLPYAFIDAKHLSGGQHRVDVVKLKGIDQPVLMYQAGRDGTWHQTDFKLLVNGQIQSVWGWHPKTNLLWMAHVEVTPDGAVLAHGDLAQLGGYTWARRYRVEPMAPDSGWKYGAKLDAEEVKIGTYPAKAADLLTAALVAHWFGKEADLTRYVPDALVRQALVNAKIGKPSYTVDKARLGVLKEKKSQDGRLVYPEIEPTLDVAIDQPVEFLIQIGQYEGYHYWAGKVVFGKALDGRLIITKFEVTKNDFVY